MNDSSIKRTHLMMKDPLKVSTTTSNFMIGVTAPASAGIYFL